jgi:hypothetical protein
MDYLVNFFDRHEHLRYAERLHCRDDDEAIGRAAHFDHAYAIELWRGDRLVHRFESCLRLAG